MNEEARASAHCAKTLSRLAVGYLKMADHYPERRQRFEAEVARLRDLANWYLARAKRMEEWNG